MGLQKKVYFRGCISSVQRKKCVSFCKKELRGLVRARRLAPRMGILIVAFLGGADSGCHTIGSAVNILRVGSEAPPYGFPPRICNLKMFLEREPCNLVG